MIKLVTIALALLLNTLYSPLLMAAERLTIYTVNYPLQYFALRIAGEYAEVVFPAPVDVDPAFWSPNTATLSQYQQADLILLNGASYAKWVDQVSLPRRRLVDTSVAFADKFIEAGGKIVHSHGAGAGHVHTGIAFTTWLDPRQALLQAEAIKQALGKKRPLLNAEFEQNFAALKRDLLELDAELKEIFLTNRQPIMLASHPVYQYMARAYELDLRSVLWEPDTMPNESQWQEVEHLAQTQAPKWMLWEAEPIAESVNRLAQMGIGTIVFDPCANKPARGDFLSVMKNNLTKLRRVL